MPPGVMPDCPLIGIMYWLGMNCGCGAFDDWYEFPYDLLPPSFWRVWLTGPGLFVRTRCEA